MVILEARGFIKRSNCLGTCFMNYNVQEFLREKANEERFIDLDEQKCNLPPQLTSGSERAFLLNSRHNSPSSCKLWLSYADTCQKVECFKRIRTLFNVNECTIDIRPKWFSKMRNLHVLHIGTWEPQKNKYIEIVDLSFLEELKNMKQLRFLSFKGVAGIPKLPDSVCQLAHLKMMNLKECSQMEEIPDDIGSLQNLSHLDVANCTLLSMLPKGIKLLSKLEVLKGFLITYDADGQLNKKACTLADLVKLEKLRKLNLVVNIVKFPRNEDLQVFKEMESLCNLKITWLSNRFADTGFENAMRQKPPRHSRWRCLRCWERQTETPQNDEIEEPTMRSIRALENLEKLVLCCFPSKTAPKWLHPSELHKLEKLYVVGGHLKTLIYVDTREYTSWNVKALHLEHTLNLIINWTTLMRIFPNMMFLRKVPTSLLSSFPVDDNGLWLAKDGVDEGLDSQDDEKNDSSQENSDDGVDEYTR